MHRFTIDWCSSKTMSEVVQRTGLDARTCSNTAAYLRRLKVPLSKMPKAHQSNREENLTAEEVQELRRLVMD